ncbi:MAG: DUF4476 domain-containing protein [Chitinophagales bacterium]|jgi:hypothetical protein|nr:DUF4476 domain-containing protein [Sphingobacteriales bacterium]
MRKSLCLLFILFTTEFLLAQCQFMSERDFEAAKYRLSGNRGNINTFQSAMDLSRAYCLSSRQAKEIANYLANDRDKFDFLKSSYPNIADRENFSDVMDVFRLFSSAIRLYHQTMAMTVTQVPNPQHLPSNPSCPRAMNPTNFNNLRNQVAIQTDDRQKASAMLNAANQCMTTQQCVSLLESIRDENIRLDVMKRLYPLVYDVENYAQAANALSASYRTQFLAFLQNPTSTPASNAQPIALAEIDFTNFLNSIRKQSFEKDKDNYIRTYMNSALMNTAQIKQVLKLMSFDATKLDLAKFLFDHCIDKQNYFQVADELQFSSSKNELNDYVKSRK